MNKIDEILDKFDICAVGYTDKPNVHFSVKDDKIIDEQKHFLKKKLCEAILENVIYKGQYNVGQLPRETVQYQDKLVDIYEMSKRIRKLFGQEEK